MLKYLLLSLMLAGTAFGEDAVLAAAKMPNRIIPQAEIRLIKRGEDVAVESIIQTRFPGKVHSKIVKSEQTNWPGHSDAAAYLAALEEAFMKYKKDTVLTICFIAGPGGTRVDFRFPPAPAWRSLPLSAAYVQKNQEYILADAFEYNAADIIQTLRKLNPLESLNGN